MSHELNILSSPTNGSSISLPTPRVEIDIRPATLSDLPFIDALQKKNTKQVGWFPTKTIEGKIARGHVLVAETTRHPTHPHPDPLPEGEGERVGYLIGHDQYFKRDDVGIIYQINIAEGKRRALVGAALLKAQFERSAYGCKLYCCWCAQDIQANYFWEALGFVPLAFRAGSEKKQRIHIFWCKRIREGDTTTPWWFPSQTMGGSMMQDRLVFPIPPGTHWSDAKPIVLPRHTHSQDTQPRQLKDSGAGRPTTRKMKPALKAITKRQPLGGGLKFQSPKSAETTVEKPKRQRKEKIKNDPKFVAAARELRDRWMEKVNSGQYLPQTSGKYEVSKTLSQAKGSQALAARLNNQAVEAKQIGYHVAVSIAA